MNKFKTTWALGAAFVVLTAGVVFADPQSVIYRKLRGTAPSAHANHSAISAVQSAAFDATPTNIRATNGNPQVAAFASFSAAGAQTAGVTCGLYHEAGGTYTFLGIAGVATATGGTSQDGSSRYLGVAPVVFDTRAATHYDLHVTAVPSVGNVTVVHYPYGGAAREEE